MTTSATQPKSTASLQALRDALEKAERQLVRLDRTNVQQFLVLLDQIEQMWTEYDDPSAMSAEEARWQSLLKRFAAKQKLVTTPAAQVGGLAKLRSQYPPATGMWWHVDDQVAGQRGQMWKRLGIGVAVLALIVVGIWIINSLTTRNTAGAADASQQIEQLVGQHSWPAAFTAVETARKSSPDDVDLMVWEAVIAEQLGRTDQAKSSLTQAQTKFTGTPAA